MAHPFTTAPIHAILTKSGKVRLATADRQMAANTALMIGGTVADALIIIGGSKPTMDDLRAEQLNREAIRINVPRLTVGAVAKLKKVPGDRVRRAIERKQLPAVRAGAKGWWMVEKAAALAWKP